METETYHLSIYTDRTFVDQEEMAVEDHSDDLAELVPPDDR